jgi:hypothetical protein
MKAEAMLKRIERAGLAERVTIFEEATAELLVTWLTPLLREHETIEQLKDAGAEWIYGDEPGKTRDRLKGYRDRLGERVCALWPFEPFAAELMVEDFADRLDDLWYPASDDVWLLSLHHRRFLTLNHEELLLFGDLGGPARWPVFQPHAHE